MTQQMIRTGFVCLVAGISALAQAPAAPPAPPAAPQAPQGPGGPGRRGPAPMARRRPPMESAMTPGPGGRWWNNPDVVQKLGINSDQQKKMDDIFQQNRIRLVDLNATLTKEEMTLEPLMGADTMDESKILSQIDKVAQARAELEKANARFLVGIRRVLTQDQWKKLQADRPQGGPGGFRGPGGPGGPGGPRQGGPGGPGGPGNRRPGGEE